ncbi:MAG: hypothetical protein AB7M93_26010 [Candidatus Obscuribacterales bacterium]
MKIVYQPKYFKIPVLMYASYNPPPSAIPGYPPSPRKFAACLLVAGNALGILAAFGGLSMLDQLIHPATSLGLSIDVGILGALSMNMSLTAAQVLWNPPPNAPTSSLVAFAKDFWSQSELHFN